VNKVSTRNKLMRAQSMEAKARLTRRWSLDDDVCLVIGTFGKQFRELCPWFVQLCLVFKRNNHGGRPVWD